MAKTVKLSETTWRKLNGLMHAFEAGKTTVLPAARESAIVRIYNFSGIDIPQFGILGITPNLTVFDPDSYEESFKKNILLFGQLPSTNYHSGGRFVVCCEPIVSGQLGRAWAAGVCAVKINVIDAAHLYADIESDSISRLTSAAGGPCTILWRQPNLGERWAIVRFGASGGTATQTTRWFYVDQVPADLPHRLICRPAVYNVQYSVWNPDTGSPQVTVYLTPQMHRSHFRPQNIIVATQMPTTGVGGGQPRWMAHYSQPSAFEEYAP